MFWLRKGKGGDKNPPAKPPAAQNSKSAPAGDVRAQALANMRAARESMGDETIQKIAAALAKRQNNPIEKAKAQLSKADPDKVLDEFKWMMQDKNREQ